MCVGVVLLCLFLSVLFCLFVIMFALSSSKLDRVPASGPFHVREQITRGCFFDFARRLEAFWEIALNGIERMWGHNY